MKALVLSCLVAATAVAQVRGDYLFSTHDGRSVQGRVLSETQSGYLVATSTGTQVVAFSNIADMRPLTATTAAATPTQPTLPMGPSPGVVAATPETFDTEHEEAEAGGLHFAVTAGLMLLPTVDPTFTFSAHGNLDWVFGRFGLRLSPGLWLYDRGGAFYVAPEVDAKFLVYLGRVYAFGAGLDAGAAIGGFPQGYLGLSLAPAILRLGSRGQHQLSLQISIPFLRFGSGLDYSAFGLPMTALGYTYRF
jgi:hypothetical protein